MESGVFSIALVAPRASGGSRSEPASADAAPILHHYITGPENHLLQAVIAFVHDEPAPDAPSAWKQTANPLYLYGPSGVGKTVLAHTLAHVWNEQQCVRGTTAKSQLLNAFVLDDAVHGSRRRGGSVPILEKIDVCVRQSIPVIVTGYVPPMADSQLEASLASRLAAGLIVPIKPPGVEARQIILRQLAEQRELSWDSNALRLAVERWPHTVVQLKALVDRASSHLATPSASITTSIVRALLADSQRSAPSQIAEIRRLVSRYFQIPIRQLVGPSRQRSCAHARAIAMYLARQLTNGGLQHIGQHFGGRDHSTVLHACQKIDTLLSKDPETRQAVSELSCFLTTR